MNRLIPIGLFISLTHSIAFPQIRGTLVIVAKASDGIMMAADSRAVYGDINPMYFDSTAKIVHVGNILFGNLGVSNTGGKGIINIVNKIDTSKWHNDITLFIRYFWKYLKVTYDSSQLKLIQKHNTFFVAGYYKGQQRVYIFGINDLVKGVVPETDYYPNYQPFLTYFVYNSKMSCKKLGKMAQRSIEKFVIDFHADWYIGGPISIAQLKPDGSVYWIQNKFEDRTPDGNIAHLLLQHKISLHLINISDKAINDSLEKAYRRTH